VVGHTPVRLAAEFQQVGRVRPVVAHVLQWDVVAGEARTVWFGTDVPVPIVADRNEGKAFVVGVVAG
jgi:hypothetical protein